MGKRKSKKTARRKSRPHRPQRKSAAKLPKDAVTIVVVLRARPGQELLLEAELRALAGQSRWEEGCFTFDLHRSEDGAAVYLLHEVWASREHHRLHTQTRHFLRWSAGKDALLASREANFWKQIA